MDIIIEIFKFTEYFDNMYSCFQALRMENSSYKDENIEIKIFK